MKRILMIMVAMLLFGGFAFASQQKSAPQRKQRHPTANSVRPPVNTAHPTIRGKAIVGDVLTGHRGKWTGEPRRWAYRWQRCDPGGTNCEVIAGARKQRYTVTTADLASVLRLQVNVNYMTGKSAAAAAPDTSVVRGPAPVPRPQPSNAFWTGDLSGDSWSQWNGTPVYNPDGNPDDYAIVNSPTPRGVTHAFEATLESGTGSILAGEDGERTLLTLWPGLDDGISGLTHAYQGANTWYRDMIYFPPHFRPTRRTAWNWLWELHNYPDSPCCANVALSVVTDHEDGGPSGGARLSLRIMGGGIPSDPIDSGAESAYDNRAAVVKWLKGPSLVTGHWYDFVVHVHWDWRTTAHGGRGAVQYWLDGDEIGSYTGPTLFYYRSLAADGSGSGPGQAYLQEGYYRPDDSDAGYAQPTASVFHADMMIGPTAKSIGETP